jgi:hypothetical protein
MQQLLLLFTQNETPYMGIVIQKSSATLVPFDTQIAAAALWKNHWKTTRHIIKTLDLTHLYWLT